MTLNEIAELTKPQSARLRFGMAGLRTGPRVNVGEQGDPAGTPILFLHGWPDSWFTFSRVLPVLSHQHRRIVLDQRGFGSSDRPGSGYTIHDLADDAVALLDALDIEQTSVVGHSLGSFVARRIAIAHPERVSRLVLIGSGMTARNPLTEDVRTALQDLPDPVPVEFVREFQAGTAYAPIPTGFFDQVIAESLKVPARVWRETFDGVLAYDDRQQLGRIASETLLMWGDRDVLFSRADQDGLLASIPGARLQVYPEIGHCPNWECPERVAADLMAFMQQ